ncbi:Cell wall protein PRY3 [Tolypocladium ophioglossoides CBS 100239]|uniref:Cell wall protein PRY3 n=1 Tax=Tolypocladium ophioglossoides (strain CBS 100239) TaxID=1163406 RepID=A0A0L0N9R9_TOLOC|nr:Cell wall protein PRY3 [Tolypocladium ophioglossoides CBS 100239]
MKLSILYPAAVFLRVALAGEANTDTASAAESPDDPKWANESTFESAILDSTNRYRGEHSAKAVAWNTTLAEFATRYLNGNNCAFQHSNGPYGENIAYGYATPTASVKAWGDERDQYNFNNPGFSPATGHFTQLVWKATTDVGCGRRWCGSRMRWFIACEYWPYGNIYGQFQQNVGRQTR